MSNYLIIPIGPPACGKSTMRTWLVERGFDQDGIVSPDDYRRILTGKQEDQTANGAAFQIADLITEHRLRRGLNVYIDATNLRKQTRNNLFNMAAATAAKVIIVLFDTPHEECARRNSHRLKPVPTAAMERMFAQDDEITKFTLRREACEGTQVYGPEQFMSYSWEFLYA